MTFVLSKINANRFYKSLTLLDIQYFIFALTYFFIYPWFGIARWRKLVEEKYPLSFTQATKIYFYGEGINLMLPSKIGDLSKAFFLNNFKICPLSFANGTVVYEKILDLLSIIIIFLFSWLVVNNSIFDSDKYIFAIIIFIVFSILIVFNLHFFSIRIKELIPNRYKNFSNAFTDFLEYFKLLKYNYRSVMIFLIFSIIFWSGHMFQIYLFMIAANISITYTQVLFYMPIVIIISLVPITIAGFGSREVSLLYLLKDITDPENIILASLMISLRYFLPGIIGFSLLLFSDNNVFSKKWFIKK